MIFTQVVAKNTADSIYLGSHGSKSLSSQLGFYDIWAQLSVIQFLQLQQLLQLYGFYGQSLKKSKHNLTGKPQENIRKPATAIFAAKILESGRLDRHAGGNIYQQMEKMLALGLRPTNQPCTSSDRAALYCWTTMGHS